MSFEAVGTGVGIHALLNGTVNVSSLVGYWLGYQVLNAVYNNAAYYFNYVLSMATMWLHPRIVQSFEITDTNGSRTLIIDRVLALFAEENPRSFDKDHAPTCKEIDIKFSIAPGTYTLTYRGRWVRLSYSRVHAIGLAGGNVTVRIWTLSTDRRFFDGILAESEKFVLKTCSMYTLNTNGAHYYGLTSMDQLTSQMWSRKGPIPVRRWVNTILTAENHRALNAAFERYYNRSQKEIDMEIPHKLCIVLSGPPGFGKTSLIKAIAHEYQLNLYIGALSRMTDAQISIIAETLRPKSALVFEDVDCMSGREPAGAAPSGGMLMDGYVLKPQKSSGAVTLSAMLNMLDGLTTLGNVVIMTTNHPEKLDEALLRSERVDVHLRLGPDPEIYHHMFERFYPEASASAGEVAEFCNRCMEKKLSMADLQAHFRANIHDFRAGLNL